MTIEAAAASPSPLDRYWAALGAHELDEARALGDSLLAGSTGVDRAWKLYIRANLARHMSDDELAATLCREGCELLLDLAAHLPLAPSLCIGMAQQTNLAGLSRLAREVLDLSAGSEESRAETWIGLRMRLTAAIEIEDALATTNCLIVPIGQECLPYDLGLRWGFSGRLIGGPFTAGVFFGDGPLTAMREDFKAFVDASAYKVVTTPSGEQTPQISKYGAVLNHQRGPFWLADDLKETRALYARRIKTFEESMAHDRVLFAMDRLYPADVAGLLSELERRRGGRPFKVFALRSDHGDPAGEPNDPRIVNLSHGRPGGTYVWWKPECYNSDQGLAYERPIAEALLQAVRETAALT